MQRRVRNPEEGNVDPTTRSRAELMDSIHERVSGERLTADPELESRTLEENVLRFEQLCITLTALSQSDPNSNEEWLQGQADQMFGDLDDARRLLNIERTRLIHYLGQNASELRDIDEEARRGLLRQIDFLPAEVADTSIVSRAILAIREQQLLGEAQGTVVERQRPSHERLVLTLEEPDFRMEDFVTHPWSSEQAQLLMPAHIDDHFLDLGNNPEDPIPREQLEANARPVMENLAEGMSAVSRHGGDPEFRDAELGTNIADTMENYLNQDHSFFTDPNTGDPTPEGQIFNDAMDLFREGDIRGAMELLQSVPQMAALFSQLNSAVLIRPRTLSFEYLNVNVRVNIDLSESDRALYDRIINGGSTEDRNALLLTLYAEARVALNAISGVIETQEIDTTDPNYPVRRVNFSPAEGEGQAYSGSVGLTVADLRQGRPIVITIGVGLGGTISELSGDSVRHVAAPTPEEPGREVEIREPVEASGRTLYALATTLDVSVPQLAGENRLFRFVRAGLTIPHPINVQLRGENAGDVTLSPDAILYGTVAVGRRGLGRGTNTWSFYTYVTGAVGVMDSQFGAIENQARLYLNARVNPQATLSWRRGRGFWMGLPMSYAAFVDTGEAGEGTVHTFAIGPEIGLSLVPGLDITLDARYTRAWGEGVPPVGPLNGFNLRTGLALTPQRWRSVVPVPEETRASDEILTPEMISGIRDEYGGAIQAAQSGNRREQREAAQALLGVLEDTSIIPEGHLLRAGLEQALYYLRFSNNARSFRQRHLQQALDQLDELRPFRSLATDIRREAVAEERADQEPSRRRRRRPRRSQD